MNKNLRFVLITIIAIIALFFIYKAAFIRTVYYEIGGIKIPSKYNILTGTVKPITNYRGKALKKTVQDTKMSKVGLSEEQVVLAQFRWALFEEWANSHPEYKGWQNNAATFKEANDAFKKEIEARGTKFKVVK